MLYYQDFWQCIYFTESIQYKMDKQLLSEGRVWSDASKYFFFNLIYHCIDS